MLWLLMMMVCSATAVAVAVPFIRHFDAQHPNEQNNLAIYQDQLQEVDRDLKLGTINAPEAAASKIEIQRRMALAQKSLVAGRPISTNLRNVFAVLATGLVIVGGISLYGVLGHPEPSQTAALPQANVMIAQLQAQLQKKPDDAEAWRMLGLAQFDAQNYPQAAAAYAKAVALDPKNLKLKSAYAEAVVMMAQGIVTPEAKAIFAEVLATEPKDARARFYDAMAQEQSGDQTGALTKWQALLADAPADAAWRNAVQQRIASLKPIAPQISADQKAQVQSLSPTDQNAMIATMVGRLAAKLEANPDNVEGWINLMKAYNVLSEPEKAKAALAKAKIVFASSAEKKAQILAAAKDLGLN